MGLVAFALLAAVGLRVALDLIINSYQSVKMLRNLSARLAKIEETIAVSHTKEGDK